MQQYHSMVNTWNLVYYMFITHHFLHLLVFVLQKSILFYTMANVRLDALKTASATANDDMMDDDMVSS